DHGEQGVGDFPVEYQLSVTKAREEVFAGMSDRLEFLQAQESCGALDRVQGPEDASQRLTLRWILFQRHQIKIELSEVFVRLDQELLGCFLKFGHSVDSRRLFQTEALMWATTPRTISRFRLLSVMADTPRRSTSWSALASVSVVAMITATVGFLLF